MNQVTIRNIPANLDQLLRKLAKKNQSSINKTIISVLEQAFGLKNKLPKKRDLSKLSGTWSKDDSQQFEENTKIFAEVDKETWES
jgi:hypothetical protein